MKKILILAAFIFYFLKIGKKNKAKVVWGEPSFEFPDENGELETYDYLNDEIIEVIPKESEEEIIEMFDVESYERENDADFQQTFNHPPPLGDYTPPKKPIKKPVKTGGVKKPIIKPFKTGGLKKPIKATGGVKKPINPSKEIFHGLGKIDLHDPTYDFLLR
jgi:hypothetical protein